MLLFFANVKHSVFKGERIKINIHRTGEFFKKIKNLNIQRSKNVKNSKIEN